MIEIIFWISIGLIIYIYLGYPLILFVLKFLFPQKVAQDVLYFPTVTLIISAFNEQTVIVEKIKNSLDLDYPRDKLQIWVVSDASTDDTDRLVKEFGNERVHLHRLGERRGKTYGITSVMNKIDSEIVVFSDANSIYDKHALRELVKYFIDPKVGYVVGHARYYKDQTSSAGIQENTYWSFEIKMKINESTIGSVVGGDGAIYAIRRELFKPLNQDDINDFVNPIQIILQGYRGVFNPKAVCYEETSSSFMKEYWRKRRIVNRSWRGLWKNARVLNPFKTGLYAWQILSHKLLRWLGGLFCLLAFVSNLLLVTSGSFFLFTMILQILFHSVALWGYYMDRKGKNANFLINLPYYFDMVNLASLQGIIDVFRGKTYTTWKTIRQE
ncbi:MAG: glycosyltransferase family 2 protein [Calditrichaeota bacterium]|nr:glycosyltransferase family 2 protein [Calditrichota bacterium]